MNLRRHLFILPVFAISLIVCAWFNTWGDWKFFEPEGFSGYYDAQALSLINGRFDVPRAAISFEAFEFGGKTYGYFGIGPTLLRVPLVVLFDNMDGRWSRSMMLLACFLNLICAYCLLLQLRDRGAARGPGQRWLDSLFIICAAIGSTNIYLVARSFTFHEAIMWGGTFALLFAVALLRYFRAPSRRWLVLAGAFAFMSFQSRATVGAGALLALCVVGVVLVWRKFVRADAGGSSLGFEATPKPLSHALIVIVILLVTVGTYLAVNYAKFRTISGLPLQYYHLYTATPSRMQVTAGKQLHLENIPTNLATYFGWRGVRIDHQFPWFNLERVPTRIGSPSIDVVEAFSTLPVSMPALTLLAGLGCWLMIRSRKSEIRRARLLALTLALGGAVVLTTVGITQRYLHDFYPALIVCAAVGMSAFAAEKRMPAKIAVMVALTLVSVALNCSFALVNQRTAPWGVPAEKRAEFARWQQAFSVK